MPARTSIYTISEEENTFLDGMTLVHNHCNLPSKLIVSLDYQHRPVPITINSIEPWLGHFRTQVISLLTPNERADYFQNVMSLRFGVESSIKNRVNSLKKSPGNYRKLLLGWIFNSDSPHAAVWRKWVESRFGLLTRYHHNPISHPDSHAYQRYLKSGGSFLSSNIELFDQLDFLYFYCQLELELRDPDRTHVTLYRGFSNLTTSQIAEMNVAYFNNLSSLTSDPELAIQFGNHIIKVSVPVYKIVCFDSLLPKVLHGEQEYMVLGGLYRVERVTYF
ncbi:hypothetical protein BCU68_11945 [Vibrio sp. 10N.286.49.B3]|uniref:NAD(+)--dinitrogen-reductase ADP-D-ribosyltransferase n=1 Tax=Vibrio sp. 10N.286.49.B3 TaxID=1880855 RepID=UPI000CAB033D|nr:NAD(+)--dinitrogen-reductase ADP-D-ribosyltransferase [Vibrio sp. 10N.286.49.B3]PMH44849.1 hypothetical protein BCU68_11945 [Vibrio sp. 10N.286.49.B3]